MQPLRTSGASFGSFSYQSSDRVKSNRSISPRRNVSKYFELSLMTLNLIVSALKRYRKCFLSFAHQSFFLLSVIDLPWIVTGVFVYQSFISDSKMWAIYTIPKAFMVYSITSIATLFVFLIEFCVFLSDLNQTMLILNL